MRSRTSMRDEQGAAVVEFALVMPILALIVFGIIDHGRAFYTVNNIVSAVREGSRYGAIRSAPLSASGQSEIRDRVRNVSAPFGGDTVRDEHIEIEFDGELVTVRVDSFPFRPLTPIASALGVGTWPITRAASTTTLTAPTSTTTSRDEGAVMTPQEPKGHGPVPLADAVQSLSGAIVYYRDIEEDHRRGLVGCRVLGRAHSLVVRARMQVDSSRALLGGALDAADSLRVSMVGAEYTHIAQMYRRSGCQS